MAEEPKPPLIPSARGGSGASGAQPAASAGANAEAGEIIDRYELVEEIGEGGMGTVWVAQQHEPVQRRVALKIIKLGMDTKEVVVRFEAERQALALMDHPNIASVLDGGSTTQGRPYFVMEYVQGKAFTEFCDDEQLSVPERLQLFMRVCSAVQHAHQKGVIHRDLKPSNILVSRADGEPTAKVIDFGIAKATSAELTQKTLFTQHSQIVGTPQYMAPEQASFSGIDIDTRADIYSLGVLLYELLTGTTPFDLRRTLESGYDELLRTIREVDPETPSTRVSSLGQQADPVATQRGVRGDILAKSLRGDLDWIVMKALEKDRTRRYDTASDFAADIGRYLAGEAVLAHPQTAGYRVRKFVRRRKRTVGVAAAILVLLVAGSVGTGIGWYRTGRANTRLLEANEAKDVALREKDAAIEARNDALAEKERQRVAAVEAQESFKIVADFQQEAIGRQLRPRDVGAEILKSVKDQMSVARTRAGQEPAEINAALAQLDELLRGVHTTDLARSVLLNGILLPASKHIERQFADRPEITSELRMSLAASFRDLGFYKERLDQLELALNDAEASGDPLGRLFQIRDEYCTTLFSLGRFAESAEMTSELLDEATRELGPADPVSLHIASGLTMTLLKLGRTDEAIRVGETAAEHWRSVEGETEFAPGILLNHLGQAYVQQGKFDRAEELYNEVQEFARTGRFDSGIEGATSNLARIRELQGRYDEAAKLYERSVEAHKSRYGNRSFETAATCNNLAYVYLALERYEEAKGILEEAIAIAIEALGEGHANVGLFTHTLGEVHLAAHEDEAALQRLNEAREIYLAAGFHRFLGSLFTQLAQVYARSAEPDAALDALEHAREYGIPRGMLSDPSFESLRSEPRFTALGR